MKIYKQSAYKWAVFRWQDRESRQTNIPEQSWEKGCRKVEEKGEKQWKDDLFTSESVTEGHPDKMCDQISDAILDALMEQDPMSRVACETATTTGLVMVMGEITTNAYVDIQKIVRDTFSEIGYTRGKFGFDAETCGVITAIDEQSADIAMGVDKALEAKENQMSEEAEIDAIGAGDQGMMFGYASDETARIYALSDRTGTQAGPTA